MRYELHRSVGAFLAELAKALGPGGPGLSGKVLARESLTRSRRSRPGERQRLLTADAFRGDLARLILWLELGPHPAGRSFPIHASHRRAVLRAVHQLETGCWRLGIELDAHLPFSRPPRKVITPLSADAVRRRSRGSNARPDVLATIGGAA
jgi:hypothetical protein